MRLLILFIFVLGLQSANPILTELKNYETKDKKIILKFEKIPRSERAQEDIKLKKKAYFKIIPPKYEVQTKTYKVIDLTKITDEMRKYYKVVEEDVIINKRKFKWVLNQKEKASKLSYVYTPWEFVPITRRTMNPRAYYPTLSKTATKLDRQTYFAEMKRIDQEKSKIKYTYIEESKKINVCIASGTIEEITKDEFHNSNLDDRYKFALERGIWKIIEKR